MPNHGVRQKQAHRRSMYGLQNREPMIYGQKAEPFIKLWGKLIEICGSEDKASELTEIGYKAYSALKKDKKITINKAQKMLNAYKRLTN